LLFPENLAAHIQAVQAKVAEISVESLTISHRSLRGITVLQMSLELRNSAMYFTFPENFSRFEVDCIDQPAVLISRRGSFTAKVEALFNRLGRLRAGDTRQKDAIAPDDR
jgi:hypothetical protein